MRKIEKMIVSFLAATLLIGLLAVPTLAAQSGSWKHNSSGWWYSYSSGGYAKNKFETIGGQKYYFNNSGYMVTGWKKIKGDWYLFAGSGAMKKGWQKSGKDWYFMDKKDGTMQTGWLTDKSKKYYLNKSGAMAVGWKKIGSKRYYFNGGGDMKTGWLKSSGSWYYLDKNGVMVTGKKVIGGKTEVFASSGVWKKTETKAATATAKKNGWKNEGGKWYYYKNYVKQKGWQLIGNDTYYFNASGVMVSGGIKTIKNKKYYFAKNGKLEDGWHKIDGKIYYFGHVSSPSSPPGYHPDKQAAMVIGKTIEISIPYAANSGWGFGRWAPEFAFDKSGALREPEIVHKFCRSGKVLDFLSEKDRKAHEKSCGLCKDGFIYKSYNSLLSYDGAFDH